MKIVIIFAVTGLLASCTFLPQKQYDVSIDENVGWLHGDCFAIKNPGIELPKALTLYDFESETKFSTATITRKAQSGDDCYALLDDRKDNNMSSGYSFYEVKTESPVIIGVGYFDLENTDSLTFNYCTTIEGIVFSVSESELNVWEGFYYLGYESEVTCGE